MPPLGRCYQREFEQAQKSAKASAATSREAEKYRAEAGLQVLQLSVLHSLCTPLRTVPSHWDLVAAQVNRAPDSFGPQPLPYITGVAVLPESATGDTHLVHVSDCGISVETQAF